MEDHKIYELNDCITESGDMSPKCAINIVGNQYKVNNNTKIRTHLYGYKWPVFRFGRIDLKATFLLEQGDEFKHNKNSDYVYSEKYQIESVKFVDERFYDKYLDLSTGEFSECSPYNIDGDYVRSCEKYDLSNPEKSQFHYARTHVSKPYTLRNPHICDVVRKN